MMRRGLDEMQAGDTLDPVDCAPISRATLALYAGASGDHNPLHIDSDFARSAGFDDVFVHGSLMMASMGEAVRRWAGKGCILRLSVRFTSIAKVGDAMRCAAVVSERADTDDKVSLRLRLDGHAQDGRRLLSGDATVQFAVTEPAMKAAGALPDEDREGEPT